jgi:hypothetical protein
MENLPSFLLLASIPRVKSTVQAGIPLANELVWLHAWPAMLHGLLLQPVLQAAPVAHLGVLVVVAPA